MKIILDTNVFSEFIHPQGSPIVAAWLMRQEDASICTTSVTQAEILFGIRRLPEGRRRSVLLANALKSFESDIVTQILSFDSIAADEYSQIVALRERSGRRAISF